MSVATWSLRERAVCRRLPASPTSAVSRRSMLRCTSSRSTRPGELAALDLAADRRHAALDRGEVGRGQHADGGEHARVRERARDVDAGEAAVEVDRRGVALDALGDRLGEAAGPAGGRAGCRGVGHGRRCPAWWQGRCRRGIGRRDLASARASAMVLAAPVRVADNSLSRAAVRLRGDRPRGPPLAWHGACMPVSRCGRL